MNLIFDFLFSQYKNYQLYDIVLEIIAVFFGFISVWYSKKNNVLVYPTGLISTIVFVYLLYKWELFGEMLINFYYVIMSFYGWYLWSGNQSVFGELLISKICKSELKYAVLYFTSTSLAIIFLYWYSDKWNGWISYADILTTGLFFVGMWLMAKRKIEHWFFWILGNAISVPLLFYKGLTFTSFQYFGFTILAIFGYVSWKKIMDNSPLNV